MVSALIVAGNAQHFLTEARQLAQSLEAVEVRRARVFPACYQGAEATLRKVEAFFRTKADALLLVYIGHGSDIGWDVDGTDRNVVRNSQLVAAIQQARAPVVLINDCCRPVRLIERIEEMDPSLQEHVLVIASCGLDGTTNESVWKHALARWQAGAQFEPRNKVVEVIKFDLGPPLQEGEPVTLGPRLCANVVRTFRSPPSEIRWGAPLDHHLFPRAWGR